MRLFVAIRIPETIREELVTLQKKIGNDYAKIKWVEQDNMHMTLKFLGDVDEDKTALVRQSLNSVEYESFGAEFSGTGGFPGESYIRVIWAGLEPADRISGLHETIEESLYSLGFPRDKKFSPHVTLGRVRFVMDKKALSDAVLSTGSFRSAEFPVNEFFLIKSTLTPEGPVYENLSGFSLEG